jgi:drug/metabolite transporter (DMT)-like permease
VTFWVALLVCTAWPLSAALGQQLARTRGREAEFWLFACAIGGPPALLLLRLLPPHQGKLPRRRPVDRVIALVAGLFLLGVLAFNLLRACVAW